MVNSQSLAEQGTKAEPDLETGAATKESLTKGSKTESSSPSSSNALGTIDTKTAQPAKPQRPMEKASLPASEDKGFLRSTPKTFTNLKGMRPPSVLLTGAGEVASTGSSNPRGNTDKNLANLRNNSPSMRSESSQQGSPTEFVGLANRLFQQAYDEVAKMLDNNLLVAFKSSDAFREMQRHKFLLVGDAGMK